MQILPSPMVPAQAPLNAAPDSGATIRGTVVSTVDGKPIPDVQVVLSADRRTVLTDAQGQFAFNGVKPGTPWVMAKKEGYLCRIAPITGQQSCVGAPPVGSNNVEVTLALMPGAVISGSMRNETGSPIRGLYVALLQRGTKDGLYVWTVVGRSVTKTDAQGLFRMSGLEPGTYLLRTMNMVDPDVPRLDTDHGYSATYYPGTPDVNGAKPIVLTGGEDLNVDLNLKNEKFHLVTIPCSWGSPEDPGAVGWSLFGFEQEVFAKLLIQTIEPGIAFVVLRFPEHIAEELRSHITR
jgi:Carboxypeptidase regulatory-like domain